MKNRFFVVLVIILDLIIIVLHQLGVTLFNCELKGDSFEVTIVSNPEEKKFVNSYEGKIDGKKYIIYIKKDKVYKCGDILSVKGKIDEPQGRRNNRGFDYSLYLKSKKILGTIRAEHVEKVGEDKTFKGRFNKKINDLRNEIIERIDSNIKKSNRGIIKGILIGNKNDLEDEIKESFRVSNLSHMLAISGAHFSYIILFCTIVLKKLKFKRLRQSLTIIFILFFMCLTNMTPSVVRAGIMAIMIILASIFKRRADVWTSLAISLLIQITFNPYVIFDVGLQLSYGGVIGIVLFYKSLEEKLNKLKELKVNKAIAVTLGANIIIMPIMMYHFSTISLTFVISNLICSSFLGIIIILGFISVCFNIPFLYSILDFFISIFSKLVSFCSKIPFSSVYIKTPSLIQIILIYILILIFYLIITDKLKLERIKKFVVIILIVVISLNFRIPTNNLIIHFIDVGQGDSCLMLHKNYVILLDGGGSKDSSFDIGKNTLLPYLLARKIKTIDYMIVSHFDADHAEGFIYVLNNMKVKNAILPIQAEESSLYKKFVSICEVKKINVIYLKRGDNFNIGDLYFETLHPSTKFISENAMNNNALVVKLYYYNTSILFTGDIEAPAEAELVKKYKDRLKSDILKVGHHGSKSSTTKDFLEAVNPKIALIGVGKDNKFGHPDRDVIGRLEANKTIIYRTDMDGEITIKIKKNGDMKIRRLIN